MTTAELEPELLAAIAKVAATEHLLVAMDFDGTLAPLVTHAGDARPLPESAEAFARLATLENTTTALISGRALASLREVAQPPENTLLIGSHGAEVWLGPDGEELTLTADQQELLDRVHELLDRIVASSPGTLLEVKPAGVVLHTRQASAKVELEANTHAHSLLDNLPGAYVSDGKRVVEVSVVHANKGEGIALTRQASGATGVIFAGDDVTDEYAFAALEPSDLGIKVGSGQTSASFRVQGPESMPAVLNAILRSRAVA